MTGSDAVVGGAVRPSKQAISGSAAPGRSLGRAPWAGAPGPGFQVEFETRFAARGRNSLKKTLAHAAS